MIMLDADVECTFCGEKFHGRCTHCHRPGVPYQYRGQTFSGLCAFEGERLCPACRDAKSAAEGVNILVTDDRPGMPDYVYNTVRDRDTVFIRVPYALRGVDGRDAHRRQRRGRA
jgi:uncharacterized protein CbrC (UPF0167 family)